MLLVLTCWIVVRNEGEKCLGWELYTLIDREFVVVRISFSTSFIVMLGVHDYTTKGVIFLSIYNNLCLFEEFYVV